MNDRKLIISQRANILARLVTDELIDATGQQEAAEAFKYCYLVLRRPARFLEKFQTGNLFLDLEAITDAFEASGRHLPLGGDLLPEEEEIILNHNSEVKTHLMEKQSRKSSLTAVR